MAGEEEGRREEQPETSDEGTEGTHRSIRAADGDTDDQHQQTSADADAYRFGEFELGQCGSGSRGSEEAPTEGDQPGDQSGEAEADAVVDLFVVVVDFLLMLFLRR